MRRMTSPHDESSRIAALVSALPPGEGVVLGPGDDAAVLRLTEGRDLVATTDAFVEGRHFDLAWMPAAAVGRRLAAANLSDLAAMAAEPRWALLSMVVPPDAPQEALTAIETACARLLASEGAAIVGGNLAAAPGPMSFTLTLLGSVERGRHWRRAGARPGDVLAVTGTPGLAGEVVAAALGHTPASLADVPAEAAARWLQPEPRVRVALALAAAGGVRAAIDVSDGLSTDLDHLARASDVGVEVLESAVRAGAWTRASDDYELLLAIDPARFDALAAVARTAGAPFTRIGVCTEGSGAHVLVRSDGTRAALEPRGWDHFGAR